MNCPRCGGEETSVKTTYSIDEPPVYKTIRTRICETCHKLFKTEEQITLVSIYNKVTMQSEYTNYDEYLEGLNSDREHQK